jgi:hypothetical protein
MKGELKIDEVPAEKRQRSASAEDLPLGGPRPRSLRYWREKLAESERTTWLDVLANVAMVSCAAALIVVDRPPPPPAGALGGVLAVAYLALWLGAELTFRRPQRLASRAGSRAHAQSA